MATFFYDGTHSITFGPESKFSIYGKLLNSKNTWNDWHLIPSSRPDLAAPGVESHLVTVPGRSGSIDLSDWITGGPVYTDRTGSWEFFVNNDNGVDNWSTVRDSVTEFLHGKRMFCVVEDDPDWVLNGRFRVEPKSGELYSTITISYVLEPFRNYWNTGYDWLWDPFNFEIGYTDGREIHHL